MNVLTFLFVITTPFSQGCTTKLMDGKDKEENKKEIIVLLRKLADMLEELEDPIMDNFDPTSQVDDVVGRPWMNTDVDDVVGRPWMNPDNYQVPSTQSTPVPRSPNGGHPPSFGMGNVNNDIDNDFSLLFTTCPLSDLGSPDGCGARAAKGEKII